MTALSSRLILVDLDNVIEEINSWKIASISKESAATVTVMVFGLNALSATDHKLQGTANPFQQLSRKVLGHLKLTGTPRLELALSLTMPETADDALLALLTTGSATSPSCKGSVETFQSIYLVSRDSGLRKALLDALYSSCQKHIPLYKIHNNDLSCWYYRMPDDQPLKRRVAPKPGLPATLATPPNVEGPTWPVNCPERVAWVWGQPIQVPVSSALIDIAQTVNRSPALLSQVGLTWMDQRTVARGMERLDHLLSSSTTGTSLGPCAEDDGLECCHLKGWMRSLGSAGRKEVVIDRVEPASAGRGAVRLHGTIHLPAGPSPMVITARSRLPVPMLQVLLGVKSSLLDLLPMLTSPFPEANLSDRSLLRSWRLLPLSRRNAFKLPTAEVGFVRTYSGRAFCVVSPGADRMLPCWWVTGTPAHIMQTQAKQDFNAALLEQPMDRIPAEAVVGTTSEPCSVALRAAVPSSSTVSASRDIGARKIVLGSAQAAGNATKVPCALFSAIARLKENVAVRSWQPIQDCDWSALPLGHGIKEEDWTQLQRLPLLLVNP